jgi:hypothetical protein
VRNEKEKENPEKEAMFVVNSQRTSKKLGKLLKKYKIFNEFKMLNFSYIKD